MLVLLLRACVRVCACACVIACVPYRHARLAHMHVLGLSAQLVEFRWGLRPRHQFHTIKRELENTARARALVPIIHPLRHVFAGPPLSRFRAAARFAAGGGRGLVYDAGPRREERAVICELR